MRLLVIPWLPLTDANPRRGIAGALRLTRVRTVQTVCVALLLPTAVAGQDPLVPHTPVALEAVLSFVDYDQGVPLHPEVVAADQQLGFRRERIVFTGGRRDRVPGLLSIPDGVGPFSVVLLMHAGAGSKEAWWEADGFERGAPLTRGLLEAGYAVLALDGENAGERTGGTDFVPITTWYFEREWWSTFRSGVLETVTDYRRALDYLTQRPELDLSSVNVVGVSMGAVTGAYLAAADSRIRGVVSASGALAPEWLFPITHLNLAPALSHCRVMTLVGNADSLVDVAWAEGFHALVEAREKELRVFEAGHRPPQGWHTFALRWITDGRRSDR